MLLSLFNRVALASLFALLLGGLAACDSGNKKVVGKAIATDITGASWGKAFTMVDTGGKTVQLTDFKGQYLMLFFGFIQCPDVCPTTLTRAVAVKKALGQDAERLKVAFVTIDPERDSADILREYMAAFDKEFIGLRGSKEQTAAIARSLKVFYMRVPTGKSYTMDHTALTYVFDASGAIRLAVSHGQSAPDVAKDIRWLMAQEAS